MANATVDVIAPKSLIIPTDLTNAGSRTLSGQLFLSGAALYYTAAGGLYRISGSSAL